MCLLLHKEPAYIFEKFNWKFGIKFRLNCRLTKGFFHNTNWRGIYFIFVRLKNRKTELKQWVEVSLAKYVGMFCHNCNYNMRFIPHTKNHIFFRILKSESILNTLWWCWNFSFSIEGISNLNCLQGREGKSQETALL